MTTIPKIIHFCWFGRNEKPEVVQRCISSWKQYLPDYQIVEWNEDNFFIDCNSYVRAAYNNKKYAFVSDYVRVHALYHQGGIYLDTDVEVFKSFNPLLEHESFWGFEQGNYIATSTIGAQKGNQLIKRFLDSYENKEFVKDDGSFDTLTNVAIVTKMLKEEGLQTNGNLQEIRGIGTFYPQTYFSPYDYINCRTLKTGDTYAMHHFHKSWLPFTVKVKTNLKKTAAKIIGGDNIARIRKLVSKA
ncbi:glycosyltransferase family 32 protein [Bacillus alkalicellulosilyticus]|uniref:glycosyltransferase family 32 protein n=1 Tax=Alkalihalobacterium alkalicellulosilyticum TaxID=1912214 RepID=UPI000997938B|nr:glycosyltransferase [Bacillus alkalicellulosilyticus]